MAANDKVNQWIRQQAGRGQAPLTPTGPYATDEAGEPMRYIAPTFAGNGAGMVQPIKKPMTTNARMNNLIRGIVTR